MSNQNKVERIKEFYPTGTRIRLNSGMSGESGMPAGLEGTVSLVDDIGDIHMEWDNGRTLALIPGQDSFSKIPQQLQATESPQVDEPQMNM